MRNVEPDDVPADSLLRCTLTDSAPDDLVTETAWGMMYGVPAGRCGADLLALCQFPFPVLDGAGAFAEPVNSRAWVLLDDTHVRQPEFEQDAAVDRAAEEPQADPRTIG